MENKHPILYFVTGNIHKFNEVSKLFQQHSVNFHLKHCEMNAIEIQADTNKEVVIGKLNAVKNKIDGSFFVEDAGFYVDEPLNGFPGVYSSYVFKTIGNQGILKLIDDFKNSRAHFSAIFALYFKPHDKIYIFEGKVYGTVSKDIRGDKGFGFDPIFIPHDKPDKTFAELTMEEKNRLSHRAKALTKLIEFLEAVK